MGFSVVPRGWTAQAATEPWTGSTFPLAFPGPKSTSCTTRALTSDCSWPSRRSRSCDSTPEIGPPHQMASDEGCTATEPIAWMRHRTDRGRDCNVAARHTAGRGYWIQLYTSGDEPARPYVRPSVVRKVLATVHSSPRGRRLRPVALTDARPLAVAGISAQASARRPGAYVVPTALASRPMRERPRTGRPQSPTP